MLPASGMEHGTNDRVAVSSSNLLHTCTARAYMLKLALCCATVLLCFCCAGPQGAQLSCSSSSNIVDAHWHLPWSSHRSNEAAQSRTDSVSCLDPYVAAAGFL
jgi:hypothetical protein